MGQNAFDRRHTAVNGHHRNFGVHGLLESRGHGIHLVRADDNAFHALGDRRFHIGGLLGRRHLAVAFDGHIALLGDLRLEGIHHVNKEGEGEARHRGQNLVFGMSDRRSDNSQYQRAGDPESSGIFTH